MSSTAKLTVFIGHMRTCFCSESKHFAVQMEKVSPAIKVNITSRFKDTGEEVLKDIYLLHVGSFIRCNPFVFEGLKYLGASPVDW